MTYRGRGFLMPAQVYGDIWPDAAGVRSGDSIPEYARYARHIAIRLSDAMSAEDLTLRDVQARCGVDHGTVSKILKGTTLPDVVTLSRLETGLGVTLWPG